MLSNGNREKRQHEYYRYLGRPIVPALCVDNGFNQDMYDRGAKDGFLITFAGQTQPTFRAIDISEMVAENGRLMDDVALYSAEELRQSGLPLPTGVEHKYKGSLINSYILNSGLVYVEINTKNGKVSFYATKNLAVIHALSNELAETEKRKKVANFHEQLATSHAELSSNTFEIIKVVNDRDGMRLSKHRLNCNSKRTVIMPMYVIGNYIDKLIFLLGNQRVMMTYFEDGVEYKLVPLQNG